MEHGESAERCVVREVFEETGLEIADPEEHGVLRYYKYDETESPAWTVYIFTARKFSGTPTNSREGILQWFPTNDLPLGQMWEDYQHWYKHLLSGKKLDGDFYFSGDFEKLSRHRIKTY